MANTKTKQVGYIIHPNRRIERVESVKAKFEYSEIRKAVNGMIAQVELKGGIMWVNDEYAINGSDYNVYATYIRNHNHKYEQDAWTAGTVLFIPHKTWKETNKIPYALRDLMYPTPEVEEDDSQGLFPSLN